MLISFLTLDDVIWLGKEYDKYVAECKKQEKEPLDRGEWYNNIYKRR